MWYKAALFFASFMFGILFFCNVMDASSWELLSTGDYYPLYVACGGLLVLTFAPLWLSDLANFVGSYLFTEKSKPENESKLITATDAEVSELAKQDQSKFRETLDKLATK